MLIEAGVVGVLENIQQKRSWKAGSSEAALRQLVRAAGKENDTQAANQARGAGIAESALCHGPLSGLKRRLEYD